MYAVPHSSSRYLIGMNPNREMAYDIFAVHAIDPDEELVSVSRVVHLGHALGLTLTAPTKIELSHVLYMAPNYKAAAELLRHVTREDREVER